MDEANRLKPAAELQKVFADAACSLGYKVLLYDGSFEDWSRQPDAPVTNPSEKKSSP